MSLKLRVMLVVLLLFLSALWVLGGVAAARLRVSMEQQLAAQQYVTVNLLAYNIDNGLRHRLDEVREIAGRLPLTPPQLAATDPAWFAGSGISPRDQLCLMTRQGILLASTTRWDTSGLEVDPAFLARAAGADSVIVSGPLKARGDDKPWLLLGLPLGGANIADDRVLLSALPVDDPLVFGSMKAFANNDTGIMVMSPRDNRFIAATDPTRLFQPLPPPGLNAMHDRYMSGYDGSGVATNSRGIEELSSAKHISATDWFIVMATPTAKAFAPASSLYTGVLGLTLLLSLVLSWLIWMFMRRELAPLERLCERIAQMRQRPEFFIPLNPEGSEEIRQLTKEFNALQERNSRSKLTVTMLENSVVGIAYLQQRQVVSCNRRMEEIFGYGPGELVGQSTRVLYADDEEYEQIGEHAYAVVATGQNYADELWLRHRDGTLFWGMLSGRALDPEAPHEGSIWIYQDMTEQRLQQDELQKFARAVEQSPVSIVITNNEGIIEYVNPAFARITGYSVHEAIGQNPRILQSGETSPEVYRDMWEHLTSGQQWRGVLKNRRKDGSFIWEEVVIGPLSDASGKVTHYVAVKEDITARRNNELALETYQHNLESMVEQRTRDLEAALAEARAAERAKDAFLANMSHEIRTPLNVVIGLSGLALRTELNDRQKDYLSKIHDSGEHLLGVINDILDLSKISASHLNLESESFALADQVKRVLALVGMRAAEKGVAIESSIAPEVPAWVRGDPLRLNQVLMNLVGNAVKFTAAGSVRLSIEALERDDETAVLRFAVTDTGIGMEPAEVEQLFKPFTQADNSITRKFGGTGLGLAISQQLVKLMGGEIGVQSRKGQGSCFSFSLRLPLGEACDDAAARGVDWQDFDRRWRFEGANVLVVDDLPMNRMIAEELLSLTGIRVDTAENGRAALECLNQAGPGGYDLVLMDVQMPEMDGVSATRMLRSMPGFATLPVIAMTAHVMEDERNSYLAAGMNDHVGKPFRPADLISVIANWLPRQKRQAMVDTTATQVASPAPVSDQTELVLPGIDVPGALERFNGKREKLLYWLRAFIDTQGTAATEIETMGAAGNQEEASKRAHLIKGQAGMLGMTELHAAAAALETSLKSGGAAAGELQVFSGALQRMIDTLRQAGLGG